MPTPLPNQTPERTALTDEHLAAARVDAYSRRHAFVDPTRLEPVQAALTKLPADWITHVLGHPAPGIRSLSWGQMVVLTEAAALDHLHLTHRAEQNRQEHARHHADMRATAQDREAGLRRQWAELRNRLPVDVFVGLNWSFGYENGSNRGRSHIVVQEDLRSGRLHRAEYTALCETPSRARPGARGLHPLRWLDRTPQHAVGPSDHNRLPDCRACLETARRVAARQP